MREYPMTPETIARARAYQQQERERITKLSGVTFDEFGRFSIGCPKCDERFADDREGKAVRKVIGHVVQFHPRQQ